MMDPGLSPHNTPSSIKPKRLNRIPALTVFVLLVAVLAVFAYIIIESGNRRVPKDKDNKSKPHVLDERGAEYIVSGKPNSGIIPASVPKQLPEKSSEKEPTKKVEKSSSLPPRPKQQIAYAAQPPRQLSPLAEELRKIRQSKLKRYQMAATAPTKTAGAIISSPDKATLNQQPIVAGNNNSDLNDIKSLLSQAAGSPHDQNRQREKKEFYNQSLPPTTYLPQTRTAPLSPLEIKAGTIIPGVMISGINSDLPGMIKAQVSQNVYDTASGAYLLIPQGSQLIGTYDNMVAYGQNRVLLSWSRVIFPDASTLELRGMPGTDQGGYAGVADQVDNHYFRIFGSALLIAAISGAYEYVQDSGNTNTIKDDESVGNTMAQAVARELASVSSAMMRKNIDIAPTIKIRPGKLLNIMVNKDILFPSTY